MQGMPDREPSPVTPLQPIVSGFGHDSTAAQVRSGVDLSGQVVIVTGG